MSARGSAPAEISPPPGWPGSRFDVVYADPPWAYWGSGAKDAAAAKHYPLMDLEEITSLPMRELMSPRAALFLWATGPKLDAALAAIAAWGLHYRGVAYVWVKTTRDGRPLGGQGVPPTFTKPTTEFVLAATTMRRGRPFPVLDLAQHQVLLAPRGAHSEKPPEIRRRIEVLCGERSRIELFARGEVAGWATWGAEALPAPEPSPDSTVSDPGSPDPGSPDRDPADPGVALQNTPPVARVNAAGWSAPH